MKKDTAGKIATLLDPDTRLDVQIGWLALLAGKLEQDVVAYSCKTDSKDLLEEEELSDGLKTVVDACPQLAPDESGGTPTLRTKTIHYSSMSSLRRMLLKDMEKEDVELYALVRKKLFDNNSEEVVNERRLFLRYVPCSIVLLQIPDATTEPPKTIGNILAEYSTGPNGKAALLLGQRLTEETDGSITALQVNPDVGNLSEEVGRKRLKRNLDRIFSTIPPNLELCVEVDNRKENGVRRTWDKGNYDIVMTGAHHHQLNRSHCAKYGQMPVIIVSTPSPFAGSLRQLLEEGMKRLVPQIPRTDRIDLVERLQSSAAFNFDFACLMVLSTAIAAIGLLQNSAAVVIGAMLVAPLMTPLLGLGLGLVQGNAVLARMSINSVLLGLGVSLLGSFAVGFLTLGFVEPTREMLARGQPGLLDLFVAYVSGLAAAYASTRKNLIAALPGVAIAAALVPPIATSGLALALGDFHLATGSLLTFIINMLTIVLASMTSLWAVGIRNVRQKSRWLVWSVNSLLALVAALGLYLSFKPTEIALSKEIPEGLVDSIRDSLGDHFQLDGLAVAYDELGMQLHVSVVGDQPAREELATKVRIAAGAHYTYPVRVRLLTRIDISSLPQEEPVDEPDPVD